MESPKGVTQGPNQIQSEYVEPQQKHTPDTLVKLVVESLEKEEFNSDEMIKVCQDPDAKKLVDDIKQEIDKYAGKTGLNEIEINLKSEGKFKLVQAESGLDIFKCSEDTRYDDEKICTCPNLQLQRILAADGFEAMEVSQSNGTNPNDGHRNDLMSRLSSTSTYLGSGLFEFALDTFIQATNGAKACVTGNQFITDDFIIYNHAIQGEDEANQFIADHIGTDKLILAPYGVNNRILGEAHFVLLAIKGNQIAIIDPKYGIDLGDAVHSDYIKGLHWQDLFDIKNCGFYVYHMLTVAIKASLGNKFPKTVGQGSLCNDLKTFFKPENQADPTPKSIRADIRKILDPSADRMEYVVDYNSLDADLLGSRPF